MRRTILLARRLVITTAIALLATVCLFGGTRHADIFMRSAAILLGIVACLQWPSRPWVTFVEVACFNAAASFALVEGALRLSGTPLAAPSWDGYRLQPRHDYGFGLRGNTLGYPGCDWKHEKPEGMVRIAALGDSFLIGPTVDYDAIFLRLMESGNPEMEVLNFGVSGAGPREYGQSLEQHALATRPDLVLIHVFIGNDITERLQMPRNLDPRCFATYRFVHRMMKMATAAKLTETSSSHDRRTIGMMSPPAFAEVESRRAAICQTPPAPAMEKKWSRALDDLEACVRYCMSRDIAVAVVLIPDEFQVSTLLWEQVSRDAALKELEMDREYPQKRLTTWARGVGVPCLDLLPSFRNSSETLYARLDTHWNEAGNRLAALCIGQWLPERGLIPASSRLRPVP